MRSETQNKAESAVGSAVRELPSIEAGYANEKRIDGSGGCADDYGTDDRFGCSASRGCYRPNRVIVARPHYFYGPYWGWGSYWGPTLYDPHADEGKVKIDTKAKDAEVFINGSFTGVTRDGKSFYLDPGNYNIEVRQAGRTQFAEQVYVVAGKTVKLRPELSADDDR